MTQLYLMQDRHTGKYKLGRSDSPTKRERTLLSQAPAIYLVAYWSDVKPSLERHMQKVFESVQERGEWFRFTEEHLVQLYAVLGDYKRMDVSLMPGQFYIDVRELDFTLCADAEWRQNDVCCEPCHQRSLAEYNKQAQRQWDRDYKAYCREFGDGAEDSQ